MSEDPGPSWRQHTVALVRQRDGNEAPCGRCGVPHLMAEDLGGGWGERASQHHASDNGVGDATVTTRTPFMAPLAK